MYVKSNIQNEINEVIANLISKHSKEINTLNKEMDKLKRLINFKKIFKRLQKYHRKYLITDAIPTQNRSYTDFDFMNR